MAFRPVLGISDFQQFRQSGGGYVDKTRFIGELLLDPSQSLLFPRPRRFGKTLNLSTLRYFLEKSGQDHSALFEGLEVWDDPGARAHFARYPVIWISFKDVKFNTWEGVLASIRAEVQRMYDQHRYLLDQGTLTPDAAERFRTILSEQGDASLYTRSLKDLTEHLARYHSEKAVILIDEYDTPIQAGFTYGFYEEVVQFFRAMFSGGLKDNPHLFKGVMTGILRVSKESLFSGLNNIGVYSMLVPEYATAFGFTEEEVAEVIDAEYLEEARNWYNGYRFGEVTIYNPWSLLCFLKNRRFGPYWLTTGSNELLRKLMVERGYGLNGEMETLLSGGSVLKGIDENIVLRDVDQTADALWSFLLFSGYLTPARSWMDPDGRTWAELIIPNREVRLCYLEIFQGWLQLGMQGSAEVDQLVRDLLAGRASEVEKRMTALLVRTLSFMDPAGRQPEKLYQGFTLGLLVTLEGRYEVRSNRESGFGRADVLVRPKQAGQPGAVLELKVLEEGETVEHALASAIEQIRERRYAAELEAAGAGPVIELGIVFDGKRAWVRNSSALSDNSGM